MVAAGVGDGTERGNLDCAESLSAYESKGLCFTWPPEH